MKEFTKADLKNRMVVEYRNGDRRMVVDDVLIGYNGFVCLSAYNAYLEMKNRSLSEFDIVKIYNTICSLTEVADEDLSLLWQRQEVKEVTMAEVEEKFGCKVKIVNNN